MNKIPQTAAMIVIGNEVLSSKVIEKNGVLAIAQLRQWGVLLKRVVYVPDEKEVIVDEIRRCQQYADCVITSGGIGPTHDDVTLESVAMACQVPLVTSAVLLDRLIAHAQKDDSLLCLDRAQLELFSRLPEGARLIDVGHPFLSVIEINHIYALPGVPRHFESLFLGLAPYFKQSPFYVGTLEVNLLEPVFAHSLALVQIRYPDVFIGSYPRTEGHSDALVKITCESKTQNQVNACFQALLSLFDAHAIVRAVAPAAMNE